jgi:hypothetical protein
VKRTSNKKVICIETEEIFNSITEAAKSVDRAVSTMSRHLHGDRQTCGGKHFKFYEEESEQE